MNNPEQPRKHGMMGTRQAIRSSRQIPGADRRDPTVESMRYEKQMAEWYETGKSPYPQKPYWREPETRVSRVRVDARVDLICSVFDLDTLARYLQTRPAAIKIASPEATNYDLVTAAAETGVPLLISTGAMSWQELDALPLLHDRCALLHCVSAYPAPPEHMNLRVLPRIRDEYRVHVGVSDHTANPAAAPVAAVALGAVIVEKHFTRDRRQPGPDHPFALEPHQFAEMAVAVADAWLMLGDGVKRVMDSEDASDRR